MAQATEAEPADDGEAAETKMVDDGKSAVFENKFFSADEDAFFRLDGQSKEAVLAFKYGGVDALLPLESIKKEFELEEGSHDAQMLDKVAEGLRFVKIIPVGGRLPEEVLSGKASWEITERHQIVAQHRVTMHLVSWLTGEEEEINDTADLIRMANDPSIKSKVNDAFDTAANALGLNDRDEVVDLINSFGEELSYIEAIRDTVNKVKKMLEKAEKFEPLYGADQSVLDNLQPMLRLLRLASGEFNDSIDQVDAQTGEIIAVLKNIDAQTEFVRETRNEMFSRLSAWEELLKKWGKEKVVRSATMENLIADTYHFLALRYLETDDWTLFSQLQDKTSERSTERIW